MSDYIPEDNLFVILKYLPVKTLLRFRCVCKDWKQFIDSPTFTQLHLSVQNPRFIVDICPTKYLVFDSQPHPLVHKLSKPLREDWPLLVGTLHGVVCLYDGYKIVLWNPSLRKILTRPFPSFFGFVNSYGFWIDPSTKEFKAVMLQQKPLPSCIMYSSSIRRGWIHIPTGKIARWKPCRKGPPVIVGGAAHWGGCLDESIDDNHRYDSLYHYYHTDNAILSFDFVQENFDIIEMPGLPCDFSPCRWQGTLSVLRWDYELPRGFEIYSRQEDSWVKMVSFKIDHHTYMLGRIFWAMEDVEARKKKRNRKKDVELERLCDLSIGETQENVKVLASGLRVRGELILHGTKTGCTALMKGLRGTGANYDKVDMAYDFVESLLFP